MPPPTQRHNPIRLLRIVAWVAFSLALIFTLFYLWLVLSHPVLTYRETSDEVYQIYQPDWFPRGAELLVVLWFGAILINLLIWAGLRAVARNITAKSYVSPLETKQQF